MYTLWLYPEQTIFISEIILACNSVFNSQTWQKCPQKLLKNILYTNILHCH